MNYYPELASLSLTEQGNFETNQTSVGWFNFTKAPFDQKAAVEQFNFFEAVAQDQIQAPIIHGKDLIGIAQAIQNPNIRPNYLFIVPDGTPNPHWASEGASGATYRGYNRSVNLTYIKPSQAKEGFLREAFDTLNKNINRVFIIEACQNSVNVVSTLENPLDGQEYFCVGLGTAAAFRQMGQDYFAYSGFVKDKAYILPTGSTSAYWVLSETQYYNIPVFTPAIIVD